MSEIDFSRYGLTSLNQTQQINSASLKGDKI